MGYASLGTAVIFLMDQITKGSGENMIILKSKNTNVFYVYFASDETVGKNLNELGTMDVVFRCSLKEAKSVYKALSEYQGELDFDGGITEDNKAGTVQQPDDSKLDAGPSGTEDRGQSKSGVLSKTEHINKADESTGDNRGSGEEGKAKREIGEGTQE